MVEFTGSNGSGLGFSSAYRGALDTLSGGRSDDVETLVRSLAPAPREISGAELALQFFSNMAANASQPGSTVLSSAASAVKPTADEYIRQVEANRKDQAALGPLAISLAKSLKPSSTQSVPRRYEINNIAKFKELFPNSFVEETDGKYYTSMNSNSFNSVYKAAPGILSLSEAKGTDDGDDFDTRTLYKDGAEVKVYTQADFDKYIALDYTEVKPAAKVDFVQRTLYKDGAEVKVYNQVDFDKYINNDWSEQKPAAKVDFVKRTLYKDGAEVEVLTQVDLDKYIALDYTEVKPAVKVDFVKRTLYKDGAEVEVLTQADFDKYIALDYTEVKPADIKELPKPNAYERLRNNATSIATQIENNEIELTNGKLPANIFSTLQLDAKQIKEVKKITINNQDGSTTELLRPGINMREVISKAYGEKVAKLMYGDEAEKSEKVEAKNNYINPLNIAGIDFNTIGGKGAKLSTAEASALANAKNSANSLNKAFNLYFENGEYNRKRAITASLAATSVTGEPTLVGRAADLFAAVTDQKARSILQEMSNSIEIILRVRSGAAVPDSEVIKYQKIYMPNSLDSAELARAKLQKLAAFVADTYDGLAAGRFARIENDQYDRNSDDPLKRSRYIYNDSSHGIVDQNTGDPLDLRSKYSTDSSGVNSAKTPTILGISKPDENGNVVVTLSNNTSLFGKAEDFE